MVEESNCRIVEILITVNNLLHVPQEIRELSFRQIVEGLADPFLDKFLSKVIELQLQRIEIAQFPNPRDHVEPILDTCSEQCPQKFVGRLRQPSQIGLSRYSDIGSDLEAAVLLFLYNNSDAIRL